MFSFDKSWSFFKAVYAYRPKAVLEKRYIKGLVGLPANLFYGTGIPASIIIIDKENADKREGIFIDKEALKE